jgi:uncharacterized protein
MFYVDTSVVVAALTPEPSTSRVQAWLAAREAGELRVSGWVIAEVSSALAIKVRTGRLTLEQRAEILATWRQLIEQSFLVEGVNAAHLETAARFVDQHELGLRAADALHLAIASGHGLKLATLDTKMSEAGAKLGVATVLL